jgi:basic membrane protein A and related proteins
MANAERTIRDLAQQGFQVIFTASGSYIEPTLAVAKDFPQTVFINIGGHKTASNVGTAFGKIEEPWYVSGLIASKMTKTNILGYVAAFPIPEVIRAINAFTLGVRKSNANARVKVVWTNSWSSAEKEREATEALIDAGTDVIAEHQDSPIVQQVAQLHGKMVIGSTVDMSMATPEVTLTSPLWNWGVFYTDVVSQVQVGTWRSKAYWGSWNDGLVDLAPISPDVKIPFSGIQAA